MGYTNSPLVSYTCLSPNNSGERTHAIDTITPHCVVGQCSVETLGNIFLPSSRQASSNYGIGADGRVGMYCEEKNRSWCTSSRSNDQRAITIECASDTTEPYAFKEIVYNKLIELCVDICKRNGKNKLIWLGDKDKTLNYTPAENEMMLTVHRWFDNKSCPGNWMYARMSDLADKVSAQLGSTDSSTEVKPEVEKYYRVRKTWADAKSQLGAYKVLQNAKDCVDKNPGYTAYDWDGNAVYPEPVKTDIGSVVQFKGGNVYTSSDASKAAVTNCKAGPAKITAKYDGKHPFHLIHTNNTSSVYGWVDESQIEGLSATQETPAEVVWKKGDKVKLKSTETKYATGATVPSWVRKSQLYIYGFQDDAHNKVIVTVNSNLNGVTGVFLKSQLDHE